MSDAQFRYNFSFIRGLLTSARTRDVVLGVADEIERNANSAGCETKTDHQVGRRVRAAVIAGYEPGSTQENSRRVLLGSLDVGSDG